MIRKLYRAFSQNFLLTYRQIRRGDGNIFTFVVYGLLYDLFLNLYKPFSVKFLNRLGGGPWHISLLNSLPGILAVFALIPGSLIISRFRRKKTVLSCFFGMSRLFILCLAFVPFMPLESQPIMFVILLSAMNFPDAISQTGLQGFLGDVFDGYSRSQAITLRNKFGQIVAPAVALITGIIVTKVPKTNSEAITIYQIFFAVAFLVGMLEVVTFMRFKEPEREAAEKAKGLGSISAIPATLKDKRFVSYLIPTIFFYFMYQSGWPLFGILQVIDLHATELQMAINVAVSGFFGFLGAGYWSKKIKKKGNDYATALAAFCLAISIFTSALSPNMYIYIAWQAFGGFTGIGIVISLLNGLLAATPEKNRVIYISVYNTFVNISLGLSPFFANALYSALGTTYAMFVVGFGRLLASVILFAIYLKHKKQAVNLP